jgi:uncharacterized protein YndB with AHSA1/START domain
MNMSALPHTLERSVTIEARPETVFRYFTDSVRWAAWWGAGSSVDPRPGGRISIRYPNGIEASGEILEIAAPRHIVFTYGYVSGQPIPVGASRVTIRLEASGSGTRLSLQHEFEDAAVRDEHVQGWRYQLTVFGNVIADEVHVDAEAAVDAWFAAWSETDTSTREDALRRLTTEDVRFRDRYSMTDGRADLLPHLAAAQRFMPGLRVERAGAVRRCQDAVLADWVMRGPDSVEKGRGTNVFVFDADNRIRAVTGFWPS